MTFESLQFKNTAMWGRFLVFYATDSHHVTWWKIVTLGSDVTGWTHTIQTNSTLRIMLLQTTTVSLS